MRPLGNRLQVQQRGAAEGHVRDADQLRVLVDRVQNTLERHRKPVRRRRHRDDMRPLPLQTEVDVVVRREVEPIRHQLIARIRALTARAPVKAARHDRLADADILVHDHTAGRGPDDAPNEVAAGDGHVPPAFFPGADAARRPGLGVLGQCAGDAARHGRERVRDQVRRLREDRKLGAPAQQGIVSHVVSLECTPQTRTGPR